MTLFIAVFIFANQTIYTMERELPSSPNQSTILLETDQGIYPAEKLHMIEKYKTIYTKIANATKKSAIERATSELRDMLSKESNEICAIISEIAKQNDLNSPCLQEAIHAEMHKRIEANLNSRKNPYPFYNFTEPKLIQRIALPALTVLYNKNILPQLVLPQQNREFINLGSNGILVFKKKDTDNGITIASHETKIGLNINLPTTTDHVTNAIISPNGQSVALLTANSLILIPKVDEDKELQIATAKLEKNDTCALLTFSPNNTDIAFKCDKNVIALHKTNGIPIKNFTINDNDTAINAFTFNSNGTAIIVGSCGGKIKLIDIGSSKTINLSWKPQTKTKNKKNAIITAISCSNDNKIIAVGYDNGNINLLLWDAQQGSYAPLLNPLSSKNKERKPIKHLRCIDNNQLISSTDSETIVWDIKSATQQCLLRNEYEQPIKSIAYIEDKKTLVTGTTDGKIISYTLPSIDQQDFYNQLTFRQALFLQKNTEIDLALREHNHQFYTFTKQQRQFMKPIIKNELDNKMASRSMMEWLEIGKTTTNKGLVRKI